MAKKLRSSLAVEGELPEYRLAAHGDDDDDLMLGRARNIVAGEAGEESVGGLTRPPETSPLLMRVLWPMKVGGGGHHGETTQAHA